MVVSGIELLKKRIKKETNLNKNEYPDTTEFFKQLALCNTVVCEFDEKTKQVKYSASSPDELALVQGDSSVGIKLIARQHGRLYVMNLASKEELKYKIEAEFPFDSIRKRMSVILKSLDGTYVLYCKGADTVMYDRISYEKNGIENLK